MRKKSIIFMSFIYILAGIYHFINPAFYLKIMPYYLPCHLILIYLSGIIEISLGIILLIKKHQKLAGWLIIVMLIVFLPVHIQMLIDTFYDKGLLFWIAVFRLPLQFYLIYWTYKACHLKQKI